MSRLCSSIFLPHCKCLMASGIGMIGHFLTLWFLLWKNRNISDKSFLQYPAATCRLYSARKSAGWLLVCPFQDDSTTVVLHVSSYHSQQQQSRCKWVTSEDDELSLGQLLWQGFSSSCAQNQQSRVNFLISCYYWQLLHTKKRKGSRR